MAVDRDVVRKMGKLARIRLAEDELDPIAGDLSRILTWIAQLGTVDVSGVEPMESVHSTSLPLREDDVRHETGVEAIMQNAPDARADHFAVPRVIE